METEEMRAPRQISNVACQTNDINLWHRPQPVAGGSHHHVIQSTCGPLYDGQLISDMATTAHDHALIQRKRMQPITWNNKLRMPCYNALTPQQLHGQANDGTEELIPVYADQLKRSLGAAELRPNEPRPNAP
jgi:hypothetical protein